MPDTHNVLRPIEDNRGKKPPKKVCYLLDGKGGRLLDGRGGYLTCEPTKARS